MDGTQMEQDLPKPGTFPHYVVSIFKLQLLSGVWQKAPNSEEIPLSCLSTGQEEQSY